MRQPEPARLLHYTCDHGASGIDADGMVKPPAYFYPLAADLMAPEDSWMPNLAWFTDLRPPLPDRRSLGLTAMHILCDRTVHQYEVPLEAWQRGVIRWWPSYCAEAIRDGRLPATARALSYTDGAMPAHWWVSRVPLPIVGKL